MHLTCDKQACHFNYNSLLKYILYFFYKITDIIPYYTNIMQRMGPIVYYRIMFRDYVIVTDPDDIQVIHARIFYK